MSSSERSSHPSPAQIEALLDFLERHPDLAKGFSKSQHAREKSRRQWEELSVTLNSIGGTIKSSKQWTKYWSDKKSAVKKKVAARAAARRKTGGGLDHDVIELSEVEERIVALFGGERFGTGDSHLGIELFPENDIHPLSQSSEGLNFDHLNVAEQRPTNRRLFGTSSSEDVFGTERSQSILRNIHQEGYSTPPPPTLSQTPSPLPMPTPSRRGATAASTSRMAPASAETGSPTSLLAQPPTPQLWATPLISEGSPSRRGATAASSSCMVPTSRDAGSSTSRPAEPPAVQLSATPTNEASPSRRGSAIGTVSGRSFRTRRSAASSLRTTQPTAIPPSQRQTEFSRITDRFLRVEEQQLEIQRSNASILRAMSEQSIERDRILSQAVTAVGEGLKYLAEAIKRNEQ